MTTIRTPKAPNLSIAPVEYSKQYADMLNNILRLYFNTIDNYAQAQIQSTLNGIVVPNFTTVQKVAIVAPVAGQTIFDTTLAKLCVYSGTAWQTVTSV
jgi:hypothetical protein